MPSLRIYAVLDLKGGVVVRGKAGDRANYRPIQSALAPSPEPLAVARAFRERLGLEDLYIADLDAIAGAPPCAEVWEALAADGFRLLVDAGTRAPADAELVARAGAEAVVAALETLPSPDALAAIVEAVGPERTVFSLDLKAGVLLGDRTGWPFPDAYSAAMEAARAGARRILVLDLAAVGSGGGPVHVELLRRLRADVPGTELITGGGVRSAADLEALAIAGVAGVLVASAFHDGAITSSDLDSIRLG